MLKFLEDFEAKASPIEAFWRLDKHSIPASPGVYFLVASAGIRFRYPSGQSPIYYIGQTQSLRTRLRGHLTYHRHVREDCRTEFLLYEARHEYGGKFGGRYFFIRTWRGLSAKRLEDIVLARFAKWYHTFPVGNGAAAWNRIESEFKKPKLPRR
jgi:hypothetical protein